MDLSHTFTVPTPVDQTWDHFQDVSSIAECFPGAQLTSAEGDTFAGSVKVKLGPIALVYNGSGTFVEKDEAARRMVVEAKGKDKRGNGTAGATVTLSMAPAAAGGTEVNVHTDLAITGKPAQFGRGVMQDVSDKLLGQFVACLEQRLGEGGGAAAVAPTPEPVDPGDPVSTPEPASSAAAAEAAAEPTVRPGDGASPPAAATPPVDTGAAALPPVGDSVSEPVIGAATTPPAAARQPASMTPPARGDDAINLGSTVLPILVKNYWKPAVAVLAGIVIIVVLLIAL